MFNSKKSRFISMTTLFAFALCLRGSPAAAEGAFISIDSDWRSTVEMAKMAADGSVHLIGKQGGTTRYGNETLVDLKGGLVLAKRSPLGVWSKAIPIKETIQDLHPMGDSTHLLVHRRSKLRPPKKGRKKIPGVETQTLSVQRMASDGKVDDEFTVATLKGGFFDLHLNGQFAANGDVYVWAHWTGKDASINGESLKKKNYQGAWIAKYNATGELKWTQQFEGGNNSLTALKIDAVALGPKGMLHIIGHFGKTAKIGNIQHRTVLRDSADERILPVYNKGTFLVQLNSLGGVVRSTQIGAHDLRVQDLAIDANGSAILAGSYRGTDNPPLNGETEEPIPLLGSLKLRDAGVGQGAFVAKFNAGHKPIWAHAFTSENAVDINTIALKNNGLVATGSFYKNAQIGSRSLKTPDRDIDAFMVSLSLKGEIEGVRHFEGSNQEKVAAITVQNNKILLFGSYKGSMAANGKINASKGRYENGFLYLID